MHDDETDGSRLPLCASRQNVITGKSLSLDPAEISKQLPRTYSYSTSTRAFTGVGDADRSRLTRK